MSFDVSPRLGDIDRKIGEDRLVIHYPPLVQFEGDEQVSEELYRSTMDNWYVAVGEVIVRTAGARDIEITPVQRERFKRTMSAAFWLDNFLDEHDDPEAARTLFQQGIDYMRGDELTAPDLPKEMPPEIASSVELLKGSVVDIPNREREEMLSIAERLGKISLLKSGAVSIKVYRELVREEGAITGRLFGLALLGSSDDGRSRAFMSWLERSIAVATLLDSTADLRKDYQSGRTAVAPMPLNRLRLGIEALRRIPGVTKGLGLAAINARNVKRRSHIELH